MKKTAFYYGGIGGIVMILCFLVPYFIYGKEMDFSKGEIIGYTSMVLCLTAVYFGIKNFRDKKQNGFISFGTAFGLGSEIAGTAALIFGIYIFFLYKFIDPGISARLMEYYKNSIINSGKSQDIIAQQLKQFQTQAEFFNSAYLQALIMILTVFVIGLIISLISAAILKRKELKPSSE